MGIPITIWGSLWGGTPKITIWGLPIWKFYASNLGINIFTGYACGSRDVLDGTIGMTDATAVHASAIDTTAIDAAALALWSQIVWTVE